MFLCVIKEKMKEPRNNNNNSTIAKEGNVIQAISVLFNFHSFCNPEGGKTRKRKNLLLFSPIY